MESKGMQNARKMLEKLGWSEGSGLGLNENGITEAIKPSGKFDQSGIGHKTYNDFQWWDHAFNKAAQAFEIKVTDDQGAVVEKTKAIGKIKTKKGSSNLKQADLAYGVFHKTGTLHNGIIESKENTYELKEETDFSLKLSDEELFKLCNGLTAHKGARHGLTASGKLARIAKQEAALLASMNASDNKTPHQPETKKKKKKSAKSSKDDNMMQTSSECDTVVSCVENVILCEKITKLKKKKKSRKETEREVGELDKYQNALISVEEKDIVHNKAEKRKKKKELRNGDGENLLSEPIEEISQEPHKKKKKSKSHKSETQHLLLEESVEQICEEPKKKKKKKSSQDV